MSIRPVSFQLAVDQHIRQCLGIFGASEFRFGLCAGTNLPYLLSAPVDIPERSPFVCVFGDPLAKDLSAANQIFERIQQRPDLDMTQALALETMAHFFRCSGCVEPDQAKRRACLERAQLLYTKLLKACGHSSMDSMLSDESFKTRLAIVTPVPDLAMISADGRRRIAHCFAGLALCALFLERSPIYFCSLVSAALAWDYSRN